MVDRDVAEPAQLDVAAAPAGSDNGHARGPVGRDRIDRLAEGVLPALIARLEASSLGELEVHEAGWRVRLRKPPRPQATNGVAGREAGAADRARPSARGVGSGATTGGAPRSGTGAEGVETQRHVVTSPAVGYYTPRDGIGPGHTVRSHEVLGHVDVLGVRQEVVAGEDGVVGRVLVEAGEAVEYGQELIRIDRTGRDHGPAGAA